MKAPSDTVFNQKDTKPDEGLLRRALADVYPAYQEILRLTESRPREWKFYGTKTGWQFKVLTGAKALLYLVPGEKSFRVVFAVRDNERDVLLKSKLPPKVKAELRVAKRYPEGYPVRLHVNGRSDLSPVRLVIGMLLTMRP